MRMRWLLKLYPRAWRERYGAEFEALLEHQPLGPRLILDIIAGALDARLAPQRSAAGLQTTSPGGVMQILSTRCAGERFTKAEQMRSALWMATAVTGFSLLYLWLRQTFGKTPVIEAFGISAFPFALALSTATLYLQRHSRAARAVIVITLFAITYLAALLAAWI